MGNTGSSSGEEVPAMAVKEGGLTLASVKAINKLKKGAWGHEHRKALA